MRRDQPGEFRQQLRNNFKLPSDVLLEKKLPEWTVLQSLITEVENLGEIEILGKSVHEGHELPLLGFSFGSKDPQAPVLGLFGGVHGLERIGAQVVLSLMKSFVEFLVWDKVTQESLKHFRIVFFPMVNPWGMLLKNRANPNGVDLMRNAPIDALEEPTFLVGGQRISPKLPWYRGNADQTLEIESSAVIDFCKKHFFQSSAVITVDFHSGFGLKDRLWFPYAKTIKPFPNLAEVSSLSEMLNRTFPNHIYQVEPQAKNYTTHGDLWDYTYDLFREQNKATYLPLCLEMGSWLWIKKNPFNLFSALGPFNPIQPHRQKRILRRHALLFDFLIRSTINHSVWSKLSNEQRTKFESLAMELWYSKANP